LVLKEDICQKIIVELNDLDHAHYLASALQDISNNSYGGDTTISDRVQKH